MDIDKKVEQFISLRDARRDLKKNYEDADRGLRVLQETLEGQLSAFMSANKTDSLKTSHGTCYTTVRYSASLADADAFMNFVIGNQAYDLLDRRANATAVRDYMSEHPGSVIPGCNLSALEHVGVRRKANGKAANDDE
jgi:hypothetical protein